jgi:transcriptional regulator with XRE-family HTH domain
MDMQIDSTRVRAERERRAWSQEHLAEVSGLALRTIQRVESTGNGSYETVKALAAVIECDVGRFVPRWLARPTRPRRRAREATGPPESQRRPSPRVRHRNHAAPARELARLTVSRPFAIAPAEDPARHE